MSPVVLGVAVALVGLCVGSFLNVVIHRLPLMMEAEWRAECAAIEGRDAPAADTLNLFTPPSRCPSCKASVRPWQNVPLVSWLVLRGRCASCRTPISARYPLVELLGGALAVLMAWRFGYGTALVAALVYAWALLALTFIDYDTQLLPDDITLPLLWLGLIVNSAGTFTDLRSAVMGAVAGYLVLWIVYWAFKLIARKEGMGYGDFKLLAAIGAWTGWQVLPFVIVLSAGLGAVIGSVALWASKRDAGSRIPFGPFLALAGIGALVWGPQAVHAWLRMPA
ncbi:MAG TPA: A24 family peptidase [Usitatibacter sp.]|jgi:leader peptidase (prepilin peptidase)/N-methyltransferase|nr:A24 family peptidase [Usitatibacter sp.]